MENIDIPSVHVTPHTFDTGYRHVQYSHHDICVLDIGVPSFIIGNVRFGTCTNLLNEVEVNGGVSSLE